MLYKDKSRVETAVKAMMHYEFDAFEANLQCCLSLRILLPLGSCEFFFLKAMSINPWTVQELGLSSQKLRTFRRNLLGADNETWSRWKFSKNMSTKHFACLPAWSPDDRWSEMIRAPGTKPTPWQRCKWRLVFDCVCTLTQVSIQMRKHAKVLKIISKKTW